MSKKMIYLVSFVLVLAIGSLAQAGLPEWEAAISGANPLHWYKFDETAGTDCVDSGSAGLGGTYDGVTLGVQGHFGAGTAVRFDWTPQNRVNLTGGTDLDTSWTVEYIVMNMKPAADQGAMALHDSDSTSVRLAGWTSLAEVGFTLYGVADYRFTPEEGLTLEDLVIPVGEWMHLTWRRDDAGGTQIFFNGKLVGTSTDSVAFPRLRIGARYGGPVNWLDAVLDESVVFGRALTDDEIIAHAAAAGLAGLSANNPSPADGAKYVNPNVELSWSPGYGAQLHILYFGDNFDDVNHDAGGFLLETTTYTPGPLELDKVYYWRVNEFDGFEIHKAEVWSFRTIPEIDPNLIGGWKFDESSGTIAYDSSGNGNDGTLEDGPIVVEGKFGQALAFEDSRIAIPASDSLTADLFQGSFTLSAWINPNRTGDTWQQIFRSMREDNTSNDTLFLNNDGRLSWRGRIGGGWAGGMCETASDIVPADQWTHVAVVGDGTNFRIYVNGALSQESAFQTTDGSNATYYIGGDPTWIGESYSGIIDDVRIYNVALSAEEIEALAQ